MYCSTGLRWPDWCFPGEVKPNQWHTMPVLSLAVDQGSDGWSAGQFLMRSQRACMVLFKDLNHRLWNDTWNAVKHSGLKALMTVAIVVLNSDHGPWHDARWFQQGVEGAAAYAAIGNVDDALFQRNYMHILEDMDWLHRLDDPELPRKTFETLPAAFQRMTEKVATSRWFGVFHSLQHFLPLWSRRYLILSYLGHPPPDVRRCASCFENQNAQQNKPQDRG